MTQRYLLCRPRGGLNDTLWQIDRCWEYARRYERTLVVDGRTSGLGRSFSHYFQWENGSSPKVLDATPDLINQLQQLPTYPSFMTGQLERDDICLQDSTNVYVEPQSGLPVTFSFKQDYIEPLLVHEQEGAGHIRGPRQSLSAISLKPEIIENVKARTHDLLGQDYVAIHVRHTDYKTKYKKLFRRIRPYLSQSPVALCTDSQEVIDFAKRYLGNVDWVYVTENASSSNATLHLRIGARKGEDTYERHQKNLALFTDLAVMVQAKNVFFLPVEQSFDTRLLSFKHRYKDHRRRLRDWVLLRNRGVLPYTQMRRNILYSGFLRLALHLREHPEKASHFFGQTKSVAERDYPIAQVLQE